MYLISYLFCFTLFINDCSMCIVLGRTRKATATAADSSDTNTEDMRAGASCFQLLTNHQMSCDGFSRIRIRSNDREIASLH